MFLNVCWNVNVGSFYDFSEKPIALQLERLGLRQIPHPSHFLAKLDVLTPGHWICWRLLLLPSVPVSLSYGLLISYFPTFRSHLSLLPPIFHSYLSFLSASEACIVSPLKTQKSFYGFPLHLHYFFPCLSFPPPIYFLFFFSPQYRWLTLFIVTFWLLQYPFMPEEVSGLRQSRISRRGIIPLNIKATFLLLSKNLHVVQYGSVVNVSVDIASTALWSCQL